MKKILLVLFLLSASAAFGQYIGAVVNHLNSDPQIYQVPEHPAHASYEPLAQEHGVIGGGGTSYAQGDRPFSDFPQVAPVPLGDTARELKKKHAMVKKARVVWEN